MIFGISPSVFMSLRVVNGSVILMNNTEYGYVLLDQFSRQFYNQTTVKIDGYMVDYTPWCTLSVAKNNTTTTSSNPSGAMCILFTVKLTNGTIVSNETYWEPPPFELSVISYYVGAFKIGELYFISIYYNPHAPSHQYPPPNSTYIWMILAPVNQSQSQRNHDIMCA